MSANTVHHDWLALIEISGPFLAVPVLVEAFPQGLEELDGIKRKRLRQAYEEWREALDMDDPQFSEMHAAWIDEVFSRGLELDEDGKGDVLKRTDWCAANLSVSLPEHGVTLAPDLAVIDEQRGNQPLMLIRTYGQDIDLNASLRLDAWAATPADRMVQLCRATDCRLGLLTNGECWMLVDAPVGAVTTLASWYARLWGQERVTLQAFVHLLGIRRFFVDEAEQLPALFDRSLKYQDEVTDALGEQVRRAVEVLIQALDKADQDRGRELLRDVKEPELYEAALTVMMRLVFLLSAEERGLLLLGDERYEASYALSTLRMQLRKESEEILERRWDAWSRLLAIFRAVFGGIEHENLRLPALGGSLFDPDRFPFLEGRAKGSDWRTGTAKPLPIDNRTVLLLLEAIQQFQGRTLSYRALDVEQIGYVYEGLLERTVKRTAEVTLELEGTKNAKAPWVKLAELESARLDGAERLAELLQQRSGSSASRVRNDLAKSIDDTLADRLLAACHGDTALRDRIKPYAYLVRTDPWGYPLVYPAGAFIVTTGSDRRETGTHYTPKSLTEAIVTETLTPIAYVGPAEGTPRELWVLKSPTELLDLKVCDPAMGSGAFLVQTCRWLADRLVEAWSQADATGKTVSVDGEVLDAPDTKEPLPRDTEARTVIARRLIAERCLYGVDLNPLAVELAKLSIWLVTLAKGRPFGFLDHNMRYGDSLLGIHRLDQLTEISMTPTGKGQQRLFEQNIKRAVYEAIKLRQKLRAMPIRDIHDVKAVARLDADARHRLEAVVLVADAMIGEALRCSNAKTLNAAFDRIAVIAGEFLTSNETAGHQLARQASASLSINLPNGRTARRPFHWACEFPEVFGSEKEGFDCILGNPPFVDSETMTKSAPEERSFISKYYSCAKGNWDLFIPFIQRGLVLSGRFGSISLISPNKWLGAPYGASIREYASSSLRVILDFSNSRAFPRVGVAAICSNFLKKFNGPVTVLRFNNATTYADRFTVVRKLIETKDSWGFLLSPHVDILMAISSASSTFAQYFSSSDPFTVSEAYELKDYLQEYDAVHSERFFKFVNTGTVDPFVSLWGSSDVRYLKSKFSKPVISAAELKKRFPRRYDQASSPKLILSGMRKFEAFFDEHGEYVAGKSSVIALPKNESVSLLTCLGILNSKLIRFFVQESFGVLGIDGGISFSGKIIEALPLPSKFPGLDKNIEVAVERVIENISSGLPVSNEMEHLNQVVFDAYSITSEHREIISKADLRC